MSWTWRALRGHSVTFAVLFACAVLGISVIAGFRHLLSELGAPWYAWLLVPIVAIAYLAKKEPEWLPDPRVRKRWARGLFFGSIILAVTLAKFGPSRNRHAPVEVPVDAPARQR